MGLFDYLNITPVVATPVNKQDGVPEISSPVSVETENNDGRYISNIVQEPVTDYSKLFQEKGIFGALEGINKDREKAYEDEVAHTKAERAKSFFGSLATLGGQAIASAMGARKFNPIQSQVPKYNERLQRLRDEKRAYDAQSQNKSLSMIFQEYDQKRRNEAAQAAADLKYERDLKMKQADQAFEIGMLGAKGKQALEQQAVKAKDAKELAALNHRYKLGEASAQVDNNKGKNKNEIAYVTKYGNVHFDNPKNKRAATYSTLEIMRNGATETERRKIDEILYEAQNGDIDSYNKAEMYVSQNLNSDPVALKHLYELAKQYGHVSTNDSQKQLQNKARGKVDGWSLSGTSPNSSINGDDGWSLK